MTTKALADQVTGSLSDAKKLADRFGGALAIIVLLAAFAIAVLLTLSAVAKRVREIGTLRAIGWPKSKVVRQLLLETTGIGVLRCGHRDRARRTHRRSRRTVITDFDSVPGDRARAGFLVVVAVGAERSGRRMGTTTHVHLTVPLHLTTLLIGFGVAMVGGLLAGAVGGWRAARSLPPCSGTAGPRTDHALRAVRRTPVFQARTV